MGQWRSPPWRRRATLPIVALTANAYGDDVETCLAAGMQAHLAKPLQMAQLADVLRLWTGDWTATTLSAGRAAA